jgi:hypothetical protein
MGQPNVVNNHVSTVTPGKTTVDVDPEALAMLMNMFKKKKVAAVLLI